MKVKKFSQNISLIVALKPFYILLVTFLILLTSLATPTDLEFSMSILKVDVLVSAADRVAKEVINKRAPGLIGQPGIDLKIIAQNVELRY